MSNKRFFRKITKGWSRFVTTKFSSIQIIVSYYIIMTIISFILMSLPFFREPGAKTSFMDMLFMSISAVSVTGLTTFDIGSVFNDRGVVLLEILFQIGGLGIMMISTFFFIISRRKITLRQRQLIMTDMNQPRLSGSVRLIRTTFGVLIWTQVIFGLIFSIHFYFGNIHASIRDALFYGFYQSISAVTNSGFDITGNSIMAYAHDHFFLLMIMFLIFLGGIGFPVIMEVREWAAYRRTDHKLPFRFSLFSKLAMSTFIILFVLGTVFIFALENQHLFKGMSGVDKLMNAMFYSMTTRNAGLQLHNLNDFQPATLLFFSFLMFIGCSPSSVGGGVRTTTVAILGIYLFSFIRSSDNVNVFGRRIDEDDVRKSVVVFNLSLMMCFIAVMILSITERHSLIAIIVEVASAFGTTGLSLGITPDLSVTGKLVIAALMFIGRVGMLYTLMLFVPKQTQDLGYTYPSEKIIIG